MSGCSIRSVFPILLLLIRRKQKIGLPKGTMEKRAARIAYIIEEAFLVHLVQLNKTSIGYMAKAMATAMGTGRKVGFQLGLFYSLSLAGTAMTGWQGRSFFMSLRFLFSFLRRVFWLRRSFLFSWSGIIGPSPYLVCFLRGYLYPSVKLVQFPFSF